MLSLFVDIVKGILLAFSLLVLIGAVTYLLFTLTDIAGTLYEAFKR